MGTWEMILQSSIIIWYPYHGPHQYYFKNRLKKEYVALGVAPSEGEGEGESQLEGCEAAGSQDISVGEEWECVAYSPEGAEEGACNSAGRTTMTNFCPARQFAPLPAPLMYHFRPSVARVTTSFPVVIASFAGGNAHCWNWGPFTLKTLFSPAVYLKTTNINH